MRIRESEEGNTGKYALDWENFNGIPPQKCTGCTDSFFLGELVAILQMNSSKFLFHESCITQLLIIIDTFLKATEDVRNEVKLRHN